MAANRILAFFIGKQRWPFGRSRLSLLPGSFRSRNDRFRVGDVVRVASGSLAGVEGTVVARRDRRLIISVRLDQPGVTIELERDLVEPAA